MRRPRAEGWHGDGTAVAGRRFRRFAPPRWHRWPAGHSRTIRYRLIDRTETAGLRLPVVGELGKRHAYEITSRHNAGQDALGVVSRFSLIFAALPRSSRR